jgi:hypothetical protein
MDVMSITHPTGMENLSMTNGFTCARCRYFYLPDPDDKAFGQCHRYAARPVVELLKHEEIDGWEMPFAEPIWPVMGEDEWCGDFALNEDFLS